MGSKNKQQYQIKPKEVSNAVASLFNKADIPMSHQQWEELDGIYNGIAESFVTIGNQVNEAINIINAAKMPDNKELIITINGLSNDLHSCTDELVAINNRHKGKTGPVPSGEELALCLDCANDYFMINDRFKALVFPALLTVTEYTAEAVEKLKADEEEKKKLATPVTIEGTATQVEETNAGNV